MKFFNHFPSFSWSGPRKLFVTKFPGFGECVAPESMLSFIKERVPASCTVEDAKDLLSILEDGEALAALGFTDADQEWVEVLHADIKAAMLNANA